MADSFPQNALTGLSSLSFISTKVLFMFKFSFGNFEYPKIIIYNF
jgi:hypothetical protein